MKNKFLAVLTVFMLCAAANRLFAEDAKQKQEASAPAAAQEEVASVVTSAQPDNAITPSAKTTPKEEKKVTSLEVKGNKSISTNVIVS